MAPKTNEEKLADKEKALKEFEKELKEIDKGLKAREKALGVGENELEAKQSALEKQAKELDEKYKDNVPEEEPGPSRADLSLIEKACKAYGIDERYMLSARIDKETGEAVVVTHGGAKVRFAKDDEVEPLDPIRVDGIIRKKMKVVAGKKK